MHRMLSTSDFGAAVGISEATVRRLADGGDLEIHRTRGGHRRIPVAEAIRYVRETGATVIRPELLGLITSGEQVSGESDAAQLFESLSNGNASQVIGVMRAMYASGNSIAQICDGPIHDAMLKIGEQWPHDKRSIFIEHRATVLCIRALCQIRVAIADPEKDAPTAIGAAPQDDPYLLPTIMASLVLHDCGYDETNLGANTPIDVLTDSVEVDRPDLVWLAITNPIRSRQQTREIDELAKIIYDYGGKFLIGGRHAKTYDSSLVQPCSTMTDLNDKARRAGREPFNDPNQLPLSG